MMCMTIAVTPVAPAVYISSDASVQTTTAAVGLLEAEERRNFTFASITLTICELARQATRTFCDSAIPPIYIPGIQVILILLFSFLLLLVSRATRRLYTVLVIRFSLLPFYSFYFIYLNIFLFLG